jgi:pimeloyl-ACP methyl ester carboxylesterase
VAGLAGRCRIAPDLRGFGLSDPLPEPWTLADYADDLAAILDQLEVEQAVVCGLSMGGYIAFEMWRKHRSRVRALVLANTRAEADSADGRRQRDATIATVRQRGSIALVESMTPKVLAPATLETQAKITGHVQTMIAETTPETATIALAALRDRADSTPLLATIDVPTLVVAGSEDAIIPVDSHREFARNIPGATLEVVDGAGHLTPLEKPESFTRLLADFLKSID